MAAIAGCRTVILLVKQHLTTLHIPLQRNYRTAACNSCHLIGQLGGASPNLTGYGTLAGTRVAGQSAHEYTFYAITEPGQYLAENFGNVMPDKYDDKLKPQDIADLIAYLLTL